MKEAGELIDLTTQFMETRLARDKVMRFCQYFSRFLTGILGKPTCVNQVQATMSLCRKLLRFWLPPKLLRLCLEIYRSHASGSYKFFAIAESISFAVYSYLDHLAFFTRVGILAKTPQQSFEFDCMMEWFWIAETVFALCKELVVLKGLRTKQDIRACKLRIFKLFCDLPCAIFVTRSAFFQGSRFNRVWCGLLGATASFLSCYQAWPARKRITK